MSIRVMTQVWEHSKHKGSALILMLAIADFASDEGYAHPGIETLAEKCRMSERNTRYVIDRLVESGELAMTQNTGRGGTNEYWITLNPNLPLFEEKGAKIAGVQRLQGCNPASKRVQSSVKKGATAIAPEPLNRTEPSSVPARRVKRPIPPNFGISKEVREWAQQNGYAQLEVHLEAFRNKAYAKGYQYIDWDRAFMEAIRANWARVERALPRPEKEMTCRRVLSGTNQLCGMPGKPHPVYRFSCEHCNLKDEAALTTRDMPPLVRQALAGLKPRAKAAP